MSEQRGVRALTAADFSFADAIGGVRGLVESVAPGAVFVAVFVATRELVPPLVAAVAVAVIAVVVRVAQRTPVTQALSGILGVGIGVVWAWRSGEAQDFYVWGLWLNAAYLAGCVVSIVVRWPAVGIVVGLLRGQPSAWRQDRVLVRRASWATWIWAGMFGARLAVQLPLYLAGDVVWLGTTRLVMGVPLWALTLWMTWLLVRSRTGSPAAESEPSPH